jgi:DNA-binding NtrC family response regulator
VLILCDEGLEPASVARYLHVQNRAGQPFVELDCARGTADDIETALFGNRPRSGTRELEAVGTSAALLAAKGGTLFIDHLGDLPAMAQRRLARVVRDGEVRTNGRDCVRVRARLIAAATPALVADARDGRFRADLLRRFGSQPVTLPALGVRPDDVAGVVQQLAAEIASAANRNPPSFTQPALTVLSAFQWPGNVAELRTALERILRDLASPIVRQEDVLRTMPVEGIAASLMTPLISLREARRRFEREYIATVLEQHQWRMSDAARTLGIERANLYRKTRQLGISRDDRAERTR